MMQAAEIQQPEGQTPTILFDGLVGNHEAEGGTWKDVGRGLLLTGTLTGRARLASSNGAPGSRYH